MCKRILKISAIFCITLLLCGVSCEKMFNPVWSIWVKNDSDKDVYFVLGFDWKNNGYYPTTQLPNDSTRLWRVKPDRKIPLNYSPDKVKINSGDSIALFVFDPDTVAKYTWKQLSIGEKYLKKYEFKCEELNANPDNYIAYP